VRLLVNARAELVIDGQEKPIATVEEKKKYIENLAADIKKKYADHKEPVAQVQVVIEAAADAPYADVYEILKMCKDAGFKKLQLRANLREKAKP
jgi:biopolymer transport protein ExbD